MCAKTRTGPFVVTGHATLGGAFLGLTGGCRSGSRRLVALHADNLSVRCHTQVPMRETPLLEDAPSVLPVLRHEAETDRQVRVQGNSWYEEKRDPHVMHGTTSWWRRRTLLALGAEDGMWHCAG